MDTSVIVLEPGTRTFRAGYAGSFPTDDEPRVRAANAVEDHSHYAADGSPHVLRPVQRGEIVNMEALEALTYHSLYDMLGWEIGNEGGVVMVEPLLMSKRSREDVAQMMFEVFNVECLFCQDQASLALYAMGKLAGCVVDVGHGKIDVSTVMDGQVNAQSIRRLPVAGQDLTEWFAHLMSTSGSSSSSARRLAPGDAEALKECCAKVAASKDEFLRLVGGPGQQQGDGGGASPSARASQGGQLEAEQWELPDGQHFITTTEGYQVGEVLMDPTVLLDVWASTTSRNRPSLASLSPALHAWSQGPGLAAIVAECTASTASAELVPSTGMAKRADQVTDVLVCGGGALMPGLPQRLLHQLKEVCSEDPAPGTCPVPEYMTAGHSLANAAWMGGVVLGRVLSAQPHWVTKWLYDEWGPSVVGRHCAC